MCNSSESPHYLLNGLIQLKDMVRIVFGWNQITMNYSVALIMPFEPLCPCSIVDVRNCFSEMYSKQFLEPHNEFPIVSIDMPTLEQPLSTGC